MWCQNSLRGSNCFSWQKDTCQWKQDFLTSTCTTLPAQNATMKYCTWETVYPWEQHFKGAFEPEMGTVESRNTLSWWKLFYQQKYLFKKSGKLFLKKQTFKHWGMKLTSCWKKSAVWLRASQDSYGKKIWAFQEIPASSRRNKSRLLQEEENDCMSCLPVTVSLFDYY